MFITGFGQGFKGGNWPLFWFRPVFAGSTTSAKTPYSTVAQNAQIVSAWQPDSWSYNFLGPVSGSQPYGPRTSIPGISVDKPSPNIDEDVNLSIITFWQPDPWTYSFLGPANGVQPYAPRQLNPSIIAVPVNNPIPNSDSIITQQIIQSLWQSEFSYQELGRTGGEQPYGQRKLSPSLIPAPVSNQPIPNADAAVNLQIIQVWQPDPWTYNFLGPRGGSQPYAPRQLNPSIIAVPVNNPIPNSDTVVVNIGIVQVWQPDPWTYSFLGPANGVQPYAPRQLNPSIIAVPVNNPIPNSDSIITQQIIQSLWQSEFSYQELGRTGGEQPYGQRKISPSLIPVPPIPNADAAVNLQIIQTWQPDPWTYSYLGPSGGSQPYIPRKLNPSLIAVPVNNPTPNADTVAINVGIIQAWQPPPPLPTLPTKIAAVKYRTPSTKTVIFYLTNTDLGNIANTFTIPSDWTSTNTIEVIGSGAAGNTSGGGGGGGYAKISNTPAYTPGQLVQFYVGKGGNPTSTLNGEATWWDSTTTCRAAGGSSHALGGGGGAGTAGTVLHTGGSSPGASSGGGGAAGFNGNGNDGTATDGGSGDNGFGGAGGSGANPGSNGTEWETTNNNGSTAGSGGGGGVGGASTASSGGNYGGGGGKTASGTSLGGNGIIRITYTPDGSSPVTFVTVGGNGSGLDGVFSVPSNWNPVNSLRGIGSGGAGGYDGAIVLDSGYGGGGGGGAYAEAYNQALMPGANYIVPHAGTGGSTDRDLSVGSGLLVKCGITGSGGAGGVGGAGGAGGLASASIGTNKQDGGSGVTATGTTSAGGGGGSGGPNGAGANGSGTTGGNGDASTGGAGGTSGHAGSIGTEIAIAKGSGGGGGQNGAGGNYGAGGGGGAGTGGGAGAGAALFVSYTPPDDPPFTQGQSSFIAAETWFDVVRLPTLQPRLTPSSVDNPPVRRSLSDPATSWFDVSQLPILQNKISPPPSVDNPPVRRFIGTPSSIWFDISQIPTIQVKLTPPPSVDNPPKKQVLSDPARSWFEQYSLPILPRSLLISVARVDNPPFQHPERSPYIISVKTGWQPEDRLPTLPRLLPASILVTATVNNPPFQHSERNPYLISVRAGWQPDVWTYTFTGGLQPFDNRKVTPPTSPEVRPDGSSGHRKKKPVRPVWDREPTQEVPFVGGDTAPVVYEPSFEKLVDVAKSLESIKKTQAAIDSKIVETKVEQDLENIGAKVPELKSKALEKFRDHRFQTVQQKREQIAEDDSADADALLLLDDDLDDVYSELTNLLLDTLHDAVAPDLSASDDEAVLAMLEDKDGHEKIKDLLMELLKDLKESKE